MLFAVTTNHCFTSARIKQSCLTNCACLVRHQRIHWGHKADSTNAGSLNIYSGRGYPSAGSTPTSPTYKSVIDVKSCTICGSGKAISISYSECVSVPSVIQHTQCMHRIIQHTQCMHRIMFYLPPFCLYHIFLLYLLKGKIFGIFLFSLQIFLKLF
jgi:hypothetical protein